MRKMAILLCLLPQLAWGFMDLAPLKGEGNRINPNESFLVGSAAENALIINQYSGNPGCYISCIGHSEGLHAIGSSFYWHGMVRISGAYRTERPSSNRLEQTCFPSGIGDSFSVQAHYETICNQNFPSCEDGCWGTGETGGFFNNRPVSP